MKKTIIIASLIVFLLAVLCFAFYPFFPVLSISNRKNPSEKIHFVNNDNTFVISYTHSVNKGRVHDHYKSDGKNLILYKTEFVNYGAGMPELDENPGAVFYKTDNTYTMEYERIIGPSFLLSVGVIAEHSVKVGDNEFFLKDFFEPKTSLIFEPENISVIEFLVCQVEY